MKNSFLAFVVTVITTILLSALACVLGTSAALAWPLSHQNVTHSILEGSLWSCISSVFLGTLTLAARPENRLAVAIGGALTVAIITGSCFFVIVGCEAAC